MIRGVGLELRVCRLRLARGVVLRRSVRFRDVNGRALGQASSKAIPWERGRALPAVGRLVDGPDPLWVTPTGFLAISLNQRRVEALFEAEAGRRLVAVAQWGHRVTWATTEPCGPEAPCLTWMAVDFERGVLLLRRTLADAPPVLGLGFGRHQGSRAAWITVGGEDGQAPRSWAAVLRPRVIEAPPDLSEPALLMRRPSPFRKPAVADHWCERQPAP